MGIKLGRVQNAFAIRDDRGRALAYVYFENDDARRSIVNGLTEAEALEIARRIAKALAGLPPIDPKAL